MLYLNIIQPIFLSNAQPEDLQFRAESCDTFSHMFEVWQEWNIGMSHV